MRLTTFVFGMLVATGMVVAWSLWSGSGVGVTLLRITVCFVLLQVGYAATVAVLALRGKGPERRRPVRTGAAREPLPNREDEVRP